MLSCVLYSQDTIYSYFYPKGVIVIEQQLDSKEKYQYRPINNPTKILNIPSSSIVKVSYKSGHEYVNKSPKEYTNEVVLECNPLTGNIYYSDILLKENLSKKELYKLFLTIPQGKITYKLILSDDVDYSQLKYLCSFVVKFAGDPYVVTGNLLLQFKDGKVRYEYSDFVAVFEIAKTKRVLSETTHKDRKIILDDAYIDVNRSDTRTFWIPIENHIKETIETLNILINNNSNNNW